jgi:signal transduction histidine kinase/ActR/RegA family two-component response regulator
MVKSLIDASSPARQRSDRRRSGPWARLAGWLRQRSVSEQALAAAEQQARRAEERLREALDALPEGIVFLDKEGRYILWNKKYAEIYHRSADLFAEGVRLIDTLRVGVARGDYPEAVGREEEWLADRMALLDNPGQRHQQLLADGRWVMIEERQTGEGGVIGLRVDITDMKRQAEALEAALERAEAASQAKNDFLANMSHEIRTPLNGVLGLAHVLLRSNLEGQQRDLVETIVASAGALNHLLSDLLDFSRLGAGRVELSLESFDLAELVTQTAALFERQAWEKGVAFNLNIDEAARRRVLGDAARLKQILVNLLSNALKFTASGSIDLTVAASALGDRYHFEVRDTGIGFEPADAERLFVRFEQADGSITRKYGGTGLGLAISRQLAGLMDGTVVAAGQVGKGAVFTLVAPLADAEPVDETPAASIAPAAESGALRILVADDNPTNRKVAELILEAVGAEVVSVENGREALEAVQAEPFHAVLMDIQMPEMDGLTAIRLIREHEAAQARARTPVIVVSANVMPEHIQASAQAGADDHIGKPIHVEELMEAISRAMQASSEQTVAA